MNPIKEIGEGEVSAYQPTGMTSEDASGHTHTALSKAGGPRQPVAALPLCLAGLGGLIAFEFQHSHEALSHRPPNSNTF